MVILLYLRYFRKSYLVDASPGLRTVRFFSVGTLIILLELGGVKAEYNFISLTFTESRLFLRGIKTSGAHGVQSFEIFVNEVFVSLLSIKI